MLSVANVAPMVSSLEILVQTPTTQQDMEKYETIDKFITKCMFKAGKKGGNCIWVVSRSLLSL